MWNGLFTVFMWVQIGCLAFFSDSSIAGYWQGKAEVSTGYGRLLGHEDGGTWVWKGIPFAKPPLGALRWRSPEEPDAWQGVRDAEKFSSGCAQFRFQEGKVGGSEDCLYLNIWRPNSKTKKLPVFVWIHGGGNSVGDASTEGYSGANFATRQNAVYVSIQYRLGVFGWLVHPALRDGDKQNDSGNFGTLDIIQSLRWVRDNIAAFGGDPKLVTIAGESAGGTNVLSMLLSPPAHGLFQRGISSSGRTPTNTLAKGEAATHDLLIQLMINDKSAMDEKAAESRLAGMSNEQIATFLRSKPFSELYAVVENGPASFGMDRLPKVFVDDVVISRSGSESFSTGHGVYVSKVPLLIGTNRDEAKLFKAGKKDLISDPQIYVPLTRILSNEWKLAGADNVARSITQQGKAPPVFVYQFQWGANVGGEEVVAPQLAYTLGACHSLDMDFFLANDGVMQKLMKLNMNTEENKPGRLALMSAIQSYIGQFMRTGNPNKKNQQLPEWKPWSNTAGPKALILDAGKQIVSIRMTADEVTAESIEADYDALPAATVERIKKERL